MSETLAFETVLSTFRVLNNPNALRVVALLADGPLSETQLAAATGFRPRLLAHLLSALGELDLVVPETGPGGYRYRLQAERLQALPQTVLQMSEPSAEPAPTPSRDDLEARTMRDFMVEGRLKSIPTQDKKRQVILRYLAGLFEPGRRYPEREVNAILQDVHPDSASLRRHLVDSGLMARDHGVYWRTEDEGLRIKD